MLMLICRALLVLALVGATLHGAGAQFGGMPGTPGGPGFGAPQAPPPQCVALKGLMDDLQKHGMAIQAANERKADVKTACRLFNNFVAGAAKAVKALTVDGPGCGAPPNVAQQVREGQANAQKIGKQVCDAAARGPAPAGPTLSDALGTSPVLPDMSQKKGAGTFETLTGNPFARP
jgi:hypothetical protein